MGRDLVSHRISMDCRELKYFQDLCGPKVNPKGRSAHFDKPLDGSPLVHALIRDDQVELHFRDGSNRKAEIKVSVVSLSWSSCHFGSQRCWFLCPGRKGSTCERRVGKLYVISGHLLCRHCGELVYESQYRDTHGDALAKIYDAQAILRRLGGTGDPLAPFPPCPKGMHFKTYHRLTLRYCDRLCTARTLLARDQEKSWALIRRVGGLSTMDARGNGG